MKRQDFMKLSFPHTPGVYFWKQGNTILYIGKATNLRDRVRSYFGKDVIATRGPHIVDMVTLADTVTYEQTDSVLEALILEARLIKKYHPKYNTKEKDNKSFYNVIITDEPLPRVLLVRNRDIRIMQLTGKISRVKFQGKIKYSFGPFPHGTVLRDALKIIRKIFPFFDYDASKKDHYAFYEQIGLIPSATIFTDTQLQKHYQKNIRHIVLFFQGKKKQILDALEKQMHTYAQHMQFEQADRIKKQLFALRHINDVSLLKSDLYDTSENNFRIEAFDVAHQSGRNTVGVMTVLSHGQADKSEYKKFIIRGNHNRSDDLASLGELLRRRFGHTEWGLPDIIVIDGGKTHYQHAQAILKELGITSIPIISVVKNEKHTPKALLGDPSLIRKHKSHVLLANNEAHRFAITFLRDKERKTLVHQTTQKKR